MKSRVLYIVIRIKYSRIFSPKNEINAKSENTRVIYLMGIRYHCVIEIKENAKISPTPKWKMSEEKIYKKNRQVEDAQKKERR